MMIMTNRTKNTTQYGKTRLMMAGNGGYGDGGDLRITSTLLIGIGDCRFIFRLIESPSRRLTSSGENDRPLPVFPMRCDCMAVNSAVSRCRRFKLLFR